MIETPPATPELDEVTRQKVRGLVGLGMRGRLVVVGSERVKIEAQKGGIFLAIVAPAVPFQHGRVFRVPSARECETPGRP